MPQEWRERVTYVVPEEQYESYVRWLQTGRNFKGVSVRPCPAAVKGIAATRHWIGKYAGALGEESFAMIDDDIAEPFIRVSEDDWHLRYTTPEEYGGMLETIEALLGEPDIAHVGVSPREGNNRFPAGPAPLIQWNTRTLRFLCYKTKEFLEVEHGRVEVMEDFDVNLQLLRKGYKNANLMYWAQDQRGTSAPGGCSDYRTLAVHDAAARKLAELHPGLVRLRQKTNKTDLGGFGTRTEVTISWKKAYEEGVKARAAAQPGPSSAAA
jgi:hypothetical protein